MDIKVEKVYKLPFCVEMHDTDDVFVSNADGMIHIIDEDGDFVTQCSDIATAEKLCNLMNDCDNEYWTGSPEL